MMTEPVAFKATYSDWKLIKTRGVVQVVMEVPLAEADAAYDVLGGMPNPSNETWFGIAPISLRPAKETKAPSIQSPATPRRDPKPAGAKRRLWEALLPQQQAAMRSGEPAFAAFLKESYPDEWHETTDANECLKMICCVASKRDLETNQKARVLWTQLDSHFQAWERVGV